MNLDSNDLKKILKGSKHARIYLVNAEKIIHSAELIIFYFKTFWNEITELSLRTFLVLIQMEEECKIIGVIYSLVIKKPTRQSIMEIQYIINKK